MPDPETSSDRDEGLRRGSTFEPADERIWELPLDGTPPPASGVDRSPNWALILAVVVIVVIVGVVVFWLF